MYLFEESTSAAPTMAPTPDLGDVNWFQTSEYANPEGGTLSQFGQSVSMYTEFFVVGAPTGQADGGARAGSVSIFNVYSSSSISTVSCIDIFKALCVMRCGSSFAEWI